MQILSITPCTKVQSALPWYVTGRLAESDAATVRAHLSDCAACQAELAIEERLRTAIGSENAVEFAPQASMRKFFDRLDELEVEHPAPAATQVGGRWRVAVAAVVILQAAGLLILGARLLVNDPRAAAAPLYVTQSAAIPAGAGPRLRVVLDPAMTLADTEQLLRGIDAQIIAGPSEARVYTLALPSRLKPAEQAASLQALRANPAVRFAEPVPPARTDAP